MPSSSSSSPASPTATATAAAAAEVSIHPPAPLYLRLIPPVLLLVLLPFGLMLALSVSRNAILTTLASVLPVMVLSKFFRPVRYYLRLTAFLLGLGTCSAWGVFVSVLLSLVGQSNNINYVVARSFHALVAPLAGWRFTVEGEEHLTQRDGPAVVIGNHQTMIDILYLGRIFPKGASIMAKKELQYTPLLGQFMTLSNAVFVNRSKRADAVAIFAKVAETMKKKALSLFIFPEGTRSASPVPSMLPLKKGAFHLAVEAQLPIIPIVCENYAQLYSSKEKRFDGGDLVIRVLPPIPTTGITSSSEDITALVDRTRSLMLEAIEDLGRRRDEINRLKGVFKKEATSAMARQSEEERRPLTQGEGAQRD